MKKTHLFATALIGLVATSSFAASTTQIASITDQSADMPGMVSVEEFYGPVPHVQSRDEIAQMPGFPITIGVNSYFAPQRGLALEDVNGDGMLEIIASSTDNKLYVWDYTGAPLPGFPVTFENLAQYPPSVADLDGDGDMEFVQLTRLYSNGGRLYVVDHEGNILPNFPISIDNHMLLCSPTLADLDDDGQLEILVDERANPGKLHVFEHDGVEWTGNWPVVLDYLPAVTPAVGDVDNDGDPEIFVASYNMMYLLETDGTTCPGWPVQVANTNFSYQSPVLVDFDGDNDLEIVVGMHGDAAGTYLYQHDGTLMPGWPQLAGTWTYCPPTVTDLDGDGALEIINGRAGLSSEYSDYFWVWDVAGNVRTGFPFGFDLGGGVEGPIATADIDGDGAREIFTDSNLQTDDHGYVWGLDADGNVLPGFPLRPAGFSYLNGVTIGDVDNDGDAELAVLSYTTTEATVNLYDLDGDYTQCVDDWSTYHARNTRGGLYTPATIVGDIDGDGDVDLSDLASILAIYNTCDGDAGYNPAVDFDSSGCINLSDLAALLANYTG